MNCKPRLIEIVLNDSWTAPGVGAFFMLLIMTLFVLSINQLPGDLQIVNASVFLWMTGISCMVAILTIIWRVKYVTEVFKNGVVIQAQVIDSSHHKSALHLRLGYTYLGQRHDKKLAQVITSKTKKLLHQTEIALVIDQFNPDHILIRDVYL